MKRLICLSLLLLAAFGCAVLKPSPEEEAAAKQRLEQCLNEQKFRIEIDYMMPRRSSGRSVTGTYSLSVDGSDIRSNLPYFGVAYSIPYGGGKVLTFEDKIDRYSDSGWRKGRRIISLLTDNEEDVIVYTITIFEDGTADISVHPRNREDISYRGKIHTEKSLSEN